jgi:hypothetical protein
MHDRFVLEGPISRSRIYLVRTNNNYSNPNITLEIIMKTFGKVFKPRRAARMAFAPRMRESPVCAILKHAFTNPIADEMHKSFPP